MKKAIAIFTILSFTFATIGPYPMTPSEAALTIGSRDETLPEFGRTSRIFNLERRNQLEQRVPPSISSPQEEIPTVEPSLGMEPKVVNISSLSYSPSPQAHQDDGTYLLEANEARRNDSLFVQVIKTVINLASLLDWLKSIGFKVGTLNVSSVAGLIASDSPAGGSTLGESESALVVGGKPLASVTSATVMSTPPTSVAVAKSASTPTMTGGEGDDDGPEIGPGGKWSVTRTFVTKGEFTLQYLIKLIKWALEFVEELNRERRDRRSASRISSEE